MVSLWFSCGFPMVFPQTNAKTQQRLGRGRGHAQLQHLRGHAEADPAATVPTVSHGHGMAMACHGYHW